MLKKLMAVSVMSVCVAGSALAASGPYLGASLGITANTANDNTFGSYRGAPFSLFAGFGGNIKDFYIGGELTGTLATGELSRHGAVRTSYGYGLSAIPGFMLGKDTFAFGRLGVVRTRFPQIRVPSGTTSQMQTGGQFGLGLQTNLTQNIDLRGEYDFIAYSKIKSGNYSASPRSDVATASLIYKF